MVDHLADPANSAIAAHRHGFEVQESWSDRIVVLSVSDAVDILSSPQLAEAICGALDKAPARLVVDLTEVNFLASVGMSVLVAAQEAADALSVHVQRHVAVRQNVHITFDGHRLPERGYYYGVIVLKPK